MTIADFNEKFFEFARKHNIPVTTYSAPKRYGIIPCRRCAFFVPGYPLPNGAVYGGLCARSQKAMDKTVDDGCGDGLLREEAAPLPPEPEQEPKP